MDVLVTPKTHLDQCALWKTWKPKLLPVGAGILQFRAFLPICVLILQHTSFKSNKRARSLSVPCRICCAVLLGWAGRRLCCVEVQLHVPSSLLSERGPSTNCPLTCFLFILAGWNSRTSVRAPSSSRHWVTAPLSSGFASSPGAGLCSLTQWCHSWPTALRSSCATCLWANLLPFAKISSNLLSGGECGKGLMWNFWSWWRFISISLLAKVYMAWSTCSTKLISSV